MRYSLSRIWKNLCHHWLVYMVSMVTFMIGVSLFIVCMNYKKTSNGLLENCKRQMAEGVYRVETYLASRDVEDSGEYYISYDTYLRIKENCGDDLAVLFSMGFIEHIFVLEPEDGVRVQIHFMNEELFAYLYGFPREGNRAYLGENAYRDLCRMGEMLENGKSEQLMFLETELYIVGDVLYMNGKTYPYQVVTPTVAETIMPGFMGDSGYHMAEAVMFPIEDVFSPVSPYKDGAISKRCIMFFQYLNETFREDLIAYQMKELNISNKEHQFEVSNEYLALKKKLDDYDYDMDRWLLLAVSILLLSGIGCIGLMFLLLDKRRHFLAVSIAYGSTLWRIGIEAVIEIFLVLCLGGTMGIVVVPLARKVIIYQEELQFNAAGIWIVIGTAAVFSLVSVLLGMHEIRVKDVATTLKEE